MSSFLEECKVYEVYPLIFTYERKCSCCDKKHGPHLFIYAFNSDKMYPVRSCSKFCFRLNIIKNAGMKFRGARYGEFKDWELYTKYLNSFDKESNDG